jgi:Flp pilus assembly protein TadG
MKTDATVRRWWRRDDGVSAVEAAILAPALLLVLTFAIAAMRIEVASQAVESAAHDAARAASLSRTAGEALANGTNTARTTLSEHNLQCATLTVHVDVSEFGRPVGQEAAVHVTVSCRISLSDLAVPGLPGSKTLTADFTSNLDQYRGRS